MTGRLADTHLGSYDCKLNTTEGSNCSTTKNKIYLKCLFFFFFFFFFFLFVCFLFVLFFNYFRFQCTKLQ